MRVWAIILILGAAAAVWSSAMVSEKEERMVYNRTHYFQGQQLYPFNPRGGGFDNAEEEGWRIPIGVLLLLIFFFWLCVCAGMAC